MRCKHGPDRPAAHRRDPDRAARWWRRSPRRIRARHPDVQFTILSRTSIEMLTQLENLEIDAGITYLDNEPLGRVTAVPLYQRALSPADVAADAPLGDRDQVTWAEVAQVPLCLLTPDMQNRRIIDGLLRDAGGKPQPTLESNSMILLFSHVRTGRWASVMPAQARRDAGPHRHDPRDPDRRAGGRAHHRPGGAGARADDAAHRRAGRRSAPHAPHRRLIGRATAID